MAFTAGEVCSPYLFFFIICCQFSNRVDLTARVLLCLNIRCPPSCCPWQETVENCCWTDAEALFSRMTFAWSSIFNKPWLRLASCPAASPPSRLLHVGQEASLTKAFSAHDVELFAKLTGDTNPLHLDTVYARTTSFQKPVVHGILVNGLISAVIGTRMHGRGHVLLHQDIRFPAPVFVNEEIVARATVRKIKMSFAFLTVSCSVEDKVVMEGEVTVMMQGSSSATASAAPQQ